MCRSPLRDRFAQTPTQQHLTRQKSANNGQSSRTNKRFDMRHSGRMNAPCRDDLGATPQERISTPSPIGGIDQKRGAVSRQTPWDLRRVSDGFSPYSDRYSLAKRPLKRYPADSETRLTKEGVGSPASNISRAWASRARRM